MRLEDKHVFIYLLRLKWLSLVRKYVVTLFYIRRFSNFYFLLKCLISFGCNKVYCIKDFLINRIFSLILSNTKLKSTMLFTYIFCSYVSLYIVQLHAGYHNNILFWVVQLVKLCIQVSFWDCLFRRICVSIYMCIPKNQQKLSIK